MATRGRVQFESFVEKGACRTEFSSKYEILSKWRWRWKRPFEFPKQPVCRLAVPWYKHKATRRDFDRVFSLLFRGKKKKYKVKRIKWRRRMRLGGMCLWVSKDSKRK
ncbi:hypothetical protein KQX54_017307 [Cotesia glomerata]|uniref:Uncharacterized protein n=1 Tax=Cotesia glomerata TaxID=32391 RepID=A0AAV7I315_COTGL|nr:hypothetical protein KQX54_017307 [Cotesia glomerata]